MPDTMIPASKKVTLLSSCIDWAINYIDTLKLAAASLEEKWRLAIGLREDGRTYADIGATDDRSGLVEALPGGLCPRANVDGDSERRAPMLEVMSQRKSESFPSAVTNQGEL